MVGKAHVIVLLLACVLQSTVIGLVYAGSIALTTNRTTYNPGDTVIVTVSGDDVCVAQKNPCVIEIMPVPFPACGYSCPTAWTWLSTAGARPLTLPANTPAGNYLVGIVYCSSYNSSNTLCYQFTMYEDAEVAIVVT